MKNKPLGKSGNSSGDSRGVFFDLYDNAEEATHLQIRADLMIAIEKTIRKRQMTQTSAADLLGVSQSRVSDIKRGRIESFTIDSLVTMLAKLGKAVDVKVKTPRRQSAA